ncbi:glucose and ribitol dehydrogenase [Lactuca sativa]|uniref:Glucose/ribitol dehydrogenase n=1 Tax=Lactuca sativa TaxID=4236 RepID=A0A9R1XBA1_LACSA|nr:glucose and ribitol dehydrogenase [Lactuca sativa]KAJ0204154.1 hypothetical protein LSAT_V11C500260840 [Lactuca sativa]
MLCSVMVRLVGSVSSRIPITQNSCLHSRRLLTSRPSTGTSNNGVVGTTTCVLRRGSSSIHTFKAKAMRREDGERRFPPQHQDGQPGKEYLMDPLPIFSDPNYKPTNKLQGKVALVIGGDSGIGRAVCYSFAKEGATIAFTYVKDVEDIDAKYTLEIINDAKISNAGDPIAIPTDVRYDKNCKDVVDKVVATYGRIDVLVNNAAVQYETYTLDDITEERLERIFRTNIFSHFFMTRHAVKHMKPGSSIINTTSALGFSGSPKLIDYASTKGAIVNFTKSLAIFLVDKGIRVNGVAPGPIWTPLEAASLNDDDIATFGSEVPMNRAAQPVEIAPSYVFLASKDSSYYTGTFLHPDGGELDNAIPSVNNNNTINP